MRLDDNNAEVSTCNPNSFYDYYSVGGRWNGWLVGMYNGKEDEKKKNIFEKKLPSYKNTPIFYQKIPKIERKIRHRPSDRPIWYASPERTHRLVWFK